MGIRNLSQYLRENCSKSINLINISELSGKKIAIDISIYLYKYEAENALIENMYIMLSIFKHYKIVPIFIFDGKPPPEKNALLQQRKECKEIAQQEYDNLKKLEQNQNYRQKDIIIAMNKLKTQIVRINKEKIDKVKELILAYGESYYDAFGEADELCALLVIKKKVWACLSEDTDLFVYGCTRVLRYFSLISHTVVLYNTNGIYNELNMTQKEFKELCVLSGTDYNISFNQNSIGLKLALKYFKQFKETKTNYSNF